jgi:hypothetical protein
MRAARFGTRKLDLLRRSRTFADHTPSYDQLGDLFATLDAEKFQHCFIAWVALMIGTQVGMIACYGKTVRPMCQEKGKNAAIHMASALAAILFTLGLLLRLRSRCG